VKRKVKERMFGHTDLVVVAVVLLVLVFVVVASISLAQCLFPSHFSASKISLALSPPRSPSLCLCLHFCFYLHQSQKVV